MEMIKAYVGNVLLRVEVPHSFPGLYVMEHAHAMECKHATRRDHPVLNLGYDCSTGREVTKAIAHSYIPVAEYSGGHICPGLRVVRKGEGIAIPQKYIRVADQQPMQT